MSTNSGIVDTTPNVIALPDLPGSGPYGSEAWLASFPRDINHFAEMPIPRNAIVVGSQTGDAPDFRTAQRAARANGSYCVLFRRGQTYGPAALNDNIQLSGPSAKQPFVISATGDLQSPRPILQKGFGVGGREFSAGPLANIAIASLDFYDPKGDPSNAVFAGYSENEAALRLVGAASGAQNILVEDCRVRFFQGGFEFQGGPEPFNTIIVRRCTVDHCYGQNWGIYAYYIRDLVIDECVFDHNGWLEATATWSGYGKSIFRHNAYLQTWPTSDSSDPQTRVLNTIFSRASSHGCQQRSGGLNDGCIYIGNPLAGFVADWSGSTISNAIADGGGFDLSIGPGNPRGDGFSLVALAAGTLDHVICIDKQDKLNTGSALYVQCLAQTSSNSGPDTPTRATISNCIVRDWTVPPGVKVLGVVGTPGALAYSNCDLSGMSGAGLLPAQKYVDPARNIATYAASLKYANAAALLTAAANNRRGAWDSRLMAAAVNAYIRAGFQIAH